MTRLLELLPPRQRRILILALPIIGGMVSQNILNLVDTAMVGHLGDEALAAAGLGGFAFFMATSFITGLGVGVQSMASRRIGEERHEEAAVPLNGGLLLAIGLALPLTSLLWSLTPEIFGALNDDAGVVDLGVPYLQVRLLGAAAVGCNFAFRGYWNGVNLSRLYMSTLVVMHLCNVLLNYLLIFGHAGFPELGVVGAAWGTMISTYIGTAIYVLLALRHARAAGFMRGLPDRATLLTQLKLAIPAGIQNFFFAGGMTAFFTIVGKIGTEELAASQVLVNLLLVALLPGMGFGLAAATLVGQALGRHDSDEARCWGYDVAKLAAGVVAVLIVPALIAPELLLGFFLKEPETLEMAIVPFRIVALGLPFDVAGLVMMHSLLGAGDSQRVMIVSVLMQWALALPLMVVLGPHLGVGLAIIWCVQSGYRIVQGGIYGLFWRQGRWAEIEV